MVETSGQALIRDVDITKGAIADFEEALIFSFEIRRIRIYDIILKDDKYFPDGIKSEFHSSFDMDPYKWIEYLRALHKIRDIEFNG